ncbi:hypothetical protein ACH4SP_19820 [Streptomyces sp. NPDC021093]|uniref:hypothetical protein n=1 Tax=Streptomyces sp. NPDC021093 TaxID=3365112 RepID=UPI00379A6BBC
MRRTSGPLPAVPAPASASAPVSAPAPARTPAGTVALTALACGLLLTGCGAPSGLGKGEPAPSASSQPQPETLWPAWSPASPSLSDAVTDPELQPAPDPLPDSPAVPAGGLAAMDQLDVLRADPRMGRLTRRGPVDKPGTPGVRPAVLHDLTGDRKPELISAVDLESGRVVLAVYTVREGKIVPILYTSGVRPVVEAIGVDLVVRGSATDGGEQAVRYRWDGNRMITVSEVRSYRTENTEGTAKEPGADQGQGPDQEPDGPRRSVPRSVPPPAPKQPRPPARTPPSAPPSAPSSTPTSTPSGAP